MIKAVVFDMDGVVYLEGEMFSKRLSKDYKVPYSVILNFFENEFQKCLEGKADLKKELHKRIKAWKWPKGTKELMEYWFNSGEISNDMIQIVKKLRSTGMVCILCTNNEKYRVRYLRKKFALDKIFDYVMASYEIGAKKPSIEVFDKIIKKTKLAPSELVFCDDDPGHVKAAIKYGMKGIIFKNVQQLEEELNTLIIN